MSADVTATTAVTATSPVTASEPDARALVMPLTQLGNADAAVCVDGVCEIPSPAAGTHDSSAQD